MNMNAVLAAKERMNSRQAAAQENAAAAAAQGQAAAARNNAVGNTMSTIWSQPANFGDVFGGVYGSQAGSNQGGNYADTYGNYQAGLANLGNNATGNYQAYAQGLQGLTANSDPYNANSAAEVARQTAISNIGSGALGAYGSAMNSALGAYGLQQQAYNLAMSQAMNANQGALSSLGQSRNNALAGLGAAYGSLGGSAAQLGGAGIQGSQRTETDTSSDQMARNRQSTRAISSDYANMYGGGGGYGGGGFYGDVSGGFSATGPEGQIASGTYGPSGGGADMDYGGTYDMGGSRRGYSESSGTNDSMARQIDRASQRSGPQMDAFLASLNAGMGGIGNAMGGVASAANAVMDSGDRNSLTAGYNAGIGSLNRANEGYYDPRTKSYVPGGRDIPGLMANQALGGLLQLGRQGYDNSNRGMNQYYNNARYAQQNSPQSQAVDALTAGYGTANNMLGGIGGAMSGGYGNAVGNIDSVRSDLNQGAAKTRGNLQSLYDGSVGNWMQGNYNLYDNLSPIPNSAAQYEAVSRGLIAREDGNEAYRARQRARSGAATPTGRRGLSAVEAGRASPRDVALMQQLQGV